VAKLLERVVKLRGGVMKLRGCVMRGCEMPDATPKLLERAERALGELSAEREGLAEKGLPRVRPGLETARGDPVRPKDVLAGPTAEREGPFAKVLPPVPPVRTGLETERGDPVRPEEVLTGRQGWLRLPSVPGEPWKPPVLRLPKPPR